MKHLAFVGCLGLLVMSACGGQQTTSQSPTAVKAPNAVATEASSTPMPSSSAAITVGSPSEGELISSPVTVSGTANVFEGTVSIRVLDARGKVIVSDFTTATCGTGCRGDYSKRVAFYSIREQQGTIEVFETSAKNGKPTNVVSIPVTLMAAEPCPPNYVHREGTGECILGD
jgi:hypothetical protein